MADFPGYNSQLPRLKKLFPNQKWIVFTDYDDEKFTELLTDFPMNNPKIVNMRETL